MLCHVAAYGKEHLKPKFHYLWDVAEQLARDPFVVDCFIVERLHLRAKRAAKDVENTRAYERSVLTGVLISHTNALVDEGSAELGLVGRAAHVPGHTRAVVSRGCVSQGVMVCGRPRLPRQCIGARLILRHGRWRSFRACAGDALR